MSLIDEFRKEVYDAINHDAHTIADGGASDYDDYRYRVGIRKGLKRALQIMEDVIEEAHKRDEKF